MRYFAIVFFSVLSVVSCKQENKQVKAQGQKEDTINKPKYDLKTVIVSDENVVDFLTWYGDFNPEKEVVFHTKFGDIEVELFEETPLHRANMIYLVKKKYYQTTYFHRVVKGFVVQGGNSDDTKTRKARRNIGEYTIPAEFNDGYKHDFAVLCSARSWEDNPEKRSSPFEFYFVHNRNGEHHLNGEHTVYGKITKGISVLDSIANQPTDRGDYPLFNIHMEASLKTEEHVQ